MSDAAEDPSPRRPTISLATIGHHRCGKTTLTAAILRVLARRPDGQAQEVSVKELDRRSNSTSLSLSRGELLAGAALRSVPPEIPLETLTVRGSEVRYATEHRSFVHVDSPGRRPWLKNASRAQALVDALVLVVSAPDSVQPQTREHLLLARALGHDQVVVFISKCELVQDGEWLDLVEHDVRELLGQSGFDGDNTRIIRGAALPVLRGEPEWERAIRDLIEVLELELRVPERQAAGAALLYVNHVFSRVPGRDGVLVDGRVLRGQIRRGESIELRGVVDDGWAIVSDLRGGGVKVDAVAAGQSAGLLLTRPGDGQKKLVVRSGQALLGASRAAVSRFTARVELFAPELGGRRTAIRDGHLSLFLFGTAVMSGRVRLAQQPTLEPGGGAEVQVELRAPVYLEPGARFVVRDGNQGPAPRPHNSRQPALWAGISGMGTVLALTT